MDKNEVKSRHTQLLRRAKNRVDNLLNMDVLDSDTRQLLLQNILSPLPVAPPRLNLPNIDMIKKHSTKNPSSATKTPLTPLKAQEGEQVRTSDPREVHTSYVRASVKSGSGDLVSAMATRLKELEKRHKIYQSELKEMHKKYHDLEVSFQNESKKRVEVEALLVELHDEKSRLEELIQGHYSRNHQNTRGNSPRGGDPSRNGKKTTCNNGPSSLQAAASTSSCDLYDGDFPGTSGASPRGAPPSPDHIRITAERGPVDPRDASSPRAMLFNPSPCAGGGDDSARGGRRPSSKLPLDVDVMIRNARVLSDHVGWKGVVVAEGQGRIVNREVVRVVIYKNGISVNDGAFRPYAWALCKAFVQDLMEGYYPYEFKDKYPGGFPIEVIDKSSEDWHPPADKSNPASVGAATNAAMNLRANNVHSLQELRSPLSKESFLNQLPRTRLTTNGRLVGIRDAIASLFQENPLGVLRSNGENRNSETIRYTTAAESAYRASLSKLEGQQSQESESEPLKNDVAAIGNLISFLIRLPDGRKVVVRMSPDNTIEQLHRELLEAVPEIKEIYANYEFCQAFPFRLYGERAETLKRLGLSRNCTLLLRASK